MELVSDVKDRLASMRESGWDNLFPEVQIFFAWRTVFPFRIWMRKYRFMVIQGLVG
jgi:hypothetical protein